jgi:hypothetical protein
MIDRRGLLAAAAGAGLGGSAWARPRALARDLTGVWTNAWYTRLERPKEFKGLVATPAEAEAFEAPRRAMRGALPDPDDVLGQNESEFADHGPGLARIRGEIRSSWIVEPPDGKIPYTAEARERLGIGKPRREDYDHVEQRPMDERCLTVPGVFAPMTNWHDGNIVEIVQTPDWLVIVGEKNHDTRIVRLGDPPPGEPPPAPGGWKGVSVGRWDGATLVIETTGLRPGLTTVGFGLKLSEHARVVERLTRSGPAEIAYLFEVEDPSLFSRPWKGELVFRAAEGRLFEYACHEGNYSLTSILSGARQAEQAKAAEQLAGTPAAR